MRESTHAYQTLQPLMSTCACTCALRHTHAATQRAIKVALGFCMRRKTKNVTVQQQQKLLLMLLLLKLKSKLLCCSARTSQRCKGLATSAEMKTAHCQHNENPLEPSKKAVETTKAWLYLPVLTQPGHEHSRTH